MRACAHMREERVFTDEPMTTRGGLVGCMTACVVLLKACATCADILMVSVTCPVVLVFLCVCI